MAINTKTFISKSNTIVRDSDVNLSLNPVMELNYGEMLSRCMIYFDHSKVKRMVEDKTYPDMSKLRHVLKMTNAASVNDKRINCLMPKSTYDGYKQRAVSFDLIFYLLPKDWDEGRGFDYTQDVRTEYHRGVSYGGSNWYQFKNYCNWGSEGVYTTDFLSKELDKFTSPAGNKSKVIIAYQHFDHGNEPIELDITDTMNKFISGELCNNGIGIAFSPVFEDTKTDYTQYVGFFTNHTNSFFEPYVETTYDDVIRDDRFNFYLNKKNRLYFYANVGGKQVNLDAMPTAEIDGANYEVKQTTKGAYYIEVELGSDSYEQDTMLYDVWSNIIYQGKDMGSVELSFVTKGSSGYFSFGLPTSEYEANNAKFTPYVYGITNLEKIKRGDIRKVNVECKIPYTSQQMYAVDNIEYRLYVMDGTRQIDVIDYSPLEMVYNTNYFLIDTNDLIPSRYYVDLKIRYGMEEIHHRDVLHFDIMNDVTERYN